MTFGHDRAPLGAGHRTKAAIDQFKRSSSRPSRSAAEPEQRPFGLPHARRQRIELRRLRYDARDVRHSDVTALDLQPLHIDRDFERDWSSGAVSA